MTTCTSTSKKRRFGLTVRLVFFVFAIMLATMLFASLLVAILHFTGTVNFWSEVKQKELTGFMTGLEPLRGLLGVFGISILLGTAVAGFLSKTALKPIRDVANATKKIAAGDFAVRLDIRGIYELEELADDFNKMAMELSSVELLRHDFINNFSHEFKTPIVSVRGFAKLLRDGDLTEAERQEYLGIIITESKRLADLATNVLNLSKYENMSLVADKASFRVDEQIRRAVVMNELRWREKELRFDVQLSETIFYGNEDLVGQIWMNLLDNAIKFSARGGSVKIRLRTSEAGLSFTIRDSGPGLSESERLRIFDKFYRGDPARSGEGNGLGLSIVSRIVELHGGTVEAENASSGGSAFIVTLPHEASSLTAARHSVSQTPPS